MTEVKPIEIEHWSIEEWNHAVLHGFFGGEPSSSERVERLVVTPERLAECLPTSSFDGAEAKKHFIAALDMTDADVSSFDVRAARRARQNGWTVQSDDAPPFVADLIATVMAGAEAGSDLWNEDRFRERLAELFNTSSTASLTHLPRLWEDLAVWLETQREAGRRFRQLVLPDRGNERLIGYSKLLAFPTRKDEKALVKALRARNLLFEEPPLHATLAAIKENLGHFSRTFQQAVSEFEAAIETTNRNMSEHRLWAAVREASGIRPTGAKSRPGSRVNVWADIGQGLFPFLGSERKFTHPELEFEPVTKAAELSTLKFWIYSPNGTDTWRAGMVTAANLFFDGHLDDLLPQAANCRTEGLLVFREDENGFGCLETRRASSGRRIALFARLDVARHLTEFLDGRLDSRLRFRPSEHTPDWAHATGIRGDAFDAIDFQEDPILGDLLSLQRTFRPARLTARNRISLGTSLLGFPETCPSFHHESATEVRAFELDGTRRFQCTKSGEVFTVPQSAGELEGKWRFEANIEGHDVGTMTLNFSTALPQTKVKSPSEPERWLVEGAIGCEQPVGPRLDCTDIGIGEESAESFDFASYQSEACYIGPYVGSISQSSKGMDWLYLSSRGFERLRFVGALGETVELGRAQTSDKSANRKWKKIVSGAQVSDPLASRVIERYKELCAARLPTDNSLNLTWTAPREISFEATSHSVSRLRTVLAAVLTNRQGVPESEIFDLFQRVLAISDWKLVRELLRAWRECGFFACGIDRRWRARRYFGIQPRFICHPFEDAFRLCLFGTVSQTLKADVSRVPGARAKPTLSRYVPELIELEVESWREVELISAELGLSPPLFLLAPNQMLADISQVTERALEKLEIEGLPVGYQVDRYWDWCESEFRYEGSNGSFELDGMRLARWRRVDAADIYVVESGGSAENALWTYSRCWALQAAHWLANKATFETTAPGTIQRIGRRGVNLPIGAGRLAAILGRACPGPVGRSDDSYDYTYDFSTDALMYEVLDALGLTIQSNRT